MASRDAKTLQTYKPCLEEGFGQKLKKILLSKMKFYFVSIVLISVENKSSINTWNHYKSCQLYADGEFIFQNYIKEAKSSLISQCDKERKSMRRYAYVSGKNDF